VICTFATRRVWAWNRAPVVQALDDRLEQQGNLALIFSLRHDFSTEWSAFVNAVAANLSIRLRKDFFLYLVQSRTLVLADPLELYASGDNCLVERPVALQALTGDLDEDGFDDLSIPADKAVTPGPSTVFLIVRYAVEK